MRTVQLDGGPLLDFVYERTLAPSFHPDELVSVASLRRGIEGGEIVAVGVVDDDGAPVAAMVGDWDRSGRVMLLSYLAVAEGARGTGLGGRLYDEVIGAWRSRYRPCAVVAEVEHPDHHETSPAYGDPAARLRFYGRHGARVLDLPYFQPALGPGRSRVHGMLLLLLHLDPELTDLAGRLRAFLAAYLEVEGVPSGDDPAVTAWWWALDGGIRMVPTDRYREVPVSVG